MSSLTYEDGVQLQDGYTLDEYRYESQDAGPGGYTSPQEAPPQYFTEPMADESSAKDPIEVEPFLEDGSEELSGSECLELKYSERFAGFREDPYGGHWSSPTQSELEQLYKYCRSVAYPPK